jgi:TctA family transporter
MGAAAFTALNLLLDPMRLLFMFAGVLAGLVVGALPGMGGTVAAAILVPFITRLDPYTGLAMLTGSLAVVHTSDTVTSVLVGTPGSAAGVPTVLEGHPMAKQGQAARALSAAYLSSLFGGLAGAIGLTLAIPIARPLVLTFGSPELFLLTALGVSFAGSLVGREPLRGVLSGLLGLLLSTVGSAPAAPEYRFTFGQLYLEDGLSLVVVALGVYGVAEVISLLARGGSVAGQIDLGRGWLQGVRDVIEHRWLVLRGSLIGIWAGILPAIGATAGTWMAYGHVVATSRDRERFGKGDVRGIIAPEAANNAVEAGDLIPTLLFSVPGSVPMAILMGALMLYGVLPGPRIVSEHLDLIFVIIWTFALANVIGAAIMFLASAPIARLTFVPFSRLAPAVILAVLLGAWQSTQQWGDLFLLLILGLMGYVMKISGWPRGPLMVGFVLGEPMERYFWLAVNLYPRPNDWLIRPAVLILGALLVAPFAWDAVRAMRTRKNEVAPVREITWTFSLDTAVTCGFIAVFAWAWREARNFLPAAALLPLTVSLIGLVLGVVQLIQEVRGRSLPAPEDGEEGVSPAIHRRAVLFYMTIMAYYVLLWLLGFQLASAIWLFAFLLFVGKLRWHYAAVYTILTLVSLNLLGRFLGVSLPTGILVGFLSGRQW